MNKEYIFVIKCFNATQSQKRRVALITSRTRKKFLEDTKRCPCPSFVSTGVFPPSVLSNGGYVHRTTTLPEQETNL